MNEESTPKKSVAILLEVIESAWAQVRPEWEQAFPDLSDEQKLEVRRLANATMSAFWTEVFPREADLHAALREDFPEMYRTLSLTLSFDGSHWEVVER